MCAHPQLHLVKLAIDRVSARYPLPKHRAKGVVSFSSSLALARTSSAKFSPQSFNTSFCKERVK